MIIQFAIKHTTPVLRVTTHEGTFEELLTDIAPFYECIEDRIINQYIEDHIINQLQNAVFDIAKWNGETKTEYIVNLISNRFDKEQIQELINNLTKVIE